jgi:hypothetical protein
MAYYSSIRRLRWNLRYAVRHWRRHDPDGRMFQLLAGSLLVLGVTLLTACSGPAGTLQPRPPECYEAGVDRILIFTPDGEAIDIC